MSRIIVCLDIKDNKVVKGINFKNLKFINEIYILCKKYEKNFIDEIILLDITYNYSKKSLSYKNIKKISKIINIPLSIGGGIRNYNKIFNLLKLGADRIVLNSILYEKIFLIKIISNYFGSQCLITAIDIKKKNKIKTYKNSGYLNTNFNLFDWVIINKKLGCGEILITSIKNDGMKFGYDLLSSYYVKKNININLILSGGFGSLNDLFYLYKYCKINSFLIASIMHDDILLPYYFKCYLNNI